MKDKKNIPKKLLFTVIPILLIVILLSFLGSKLFDKSYSLDEGMNNISAFVDGEDNPTSVSFILEYLDHESKENIDGNEVKISAPSEITIQYLNVNTHEIIDAPNNKIVLDGDGVIVKLDGIEKGNTYDITIIPTEKREGLKSSYSKAIIKIDYQDNLHAFIDKLYDSDNKEVSLSDNDKIVFLYTDNEDKIKLRANEDVEISYYYSTTELSDEELSSKNFVVYDKNNYLKVSTNGYLYAKSKYKTDGYSKISVLHITNIDKLKPSIIINGVTLNATHDEATISYSIVDQNATLENGKSGISKYAFSISSVISDDDYIAATGDNTYSVTVNENATYYFHAYDNAGNYSIEQRNITEIDPIELEPVILILSSPKAELIGREYYSLKAFHDDLINNGITSDDEIIAQIEYDITNQHLDVESVNLTLDLNGYNVHSTKYDSTIKINDGAKLKIIDDKLNLNDYFSDTTFDISKYNHGSSTGKVTSDNNYAIKIDNNGILNVGQDNSTDMAHIEYPDHNSPYIYGKDGGVFVDEHGEFNYYDGIIIGRVAVDGAVNDTPPLYDPSTLADENGYKMSLELVSNIEALIGKTRYTLLEDAIEAANKYKGDSTTQIEIDVVKDLTKDHTIEIDNTKNILLDMNSYKLVNSVKQPLITNSGKLELRDSTGETVFFKEYNVYSYAIYNKTGADLTIDNGVYQTEITQVIYNEHDANITINGGSIISTRGGNTGCRGALENNGGSVTVNGGLIQGAHCTYYYDSSGYSIMNDDYYTNNLVESAKKTYTSFYNKTQYDFDYGFNVNEDGYLVSNNSLDPGKNAYALVELDTNGIPNGTKVKARITYNHVAPVHAVARVNISSSDYPVTGGSDLWETRGDQIAERDGIVRDGKIYLHIYYPLTKDARPGENTFTVKEVELIPYETSISHLTINDGELSNAYYCLSNTSASDNIVINGGTLSCSQSVVNNDNAKITINNGTFNARVGARNQGLIYINGGTIDEVYNYKSKINIEDGTIDQITNEDVYDATYGIKDLAYINVNGGIINNVENNYTFNASHVTFTGDFNNTSRFPVTVSDSTFNYEKELYHNAYQQINIDNTGLTTFNNVIMNSNITTKTCWIPINPYSAIKKSNESTLILNQVTINETGQAASFFDSEPTPLSLIRGIYNVGSGPIYLNDVSINQSTDHVKFVTDGIYNTGSGTIYYGTQNGVYNDKAGYIKSERYGVYSPTAMFNFYDGIIYGKNEASYTLINDIEESYYLLNGSDDNYKFIKQTKEKQNNVLHVESGIMYSSIGNALTSIGDSGTLRVLADNLYEMANYSNTIKNSQNITIDLNGKNLYLGAGLINNGVLNIVDNSENKGLIKSHQIINNNTLNISDCKIIFEFNRTSGLLNNGNVTVNNIDVSNISANSMQALFENNNIMTVNGENTKMSTGTYRFLRVFKNNYTGKLYINDGTYDQINDFDGGNIDGYILYNEGGYSEINGGTMNVYSKSSKNASANAIYGIAIPPKFTKLSGDNYTYENGIVKTYYTGHGYLPIDLSDYSGNVEIKIDYNTLSDDSFKFYIGEDLDNLTEFYSNNKSEIGFASTTVMGGKNYYFVFESGQLVFRDIIITQNNNEKSLFNVGNIVANDLTLIEKGTNPSIILNNGKFTFNDGIIKNSTTSRYGTGILLNHGSRLYTSGGLIYNKDQPIKFSSGSYGYINGLDIVDDTKQNDFIGLYMDESIVDIDDINITSNSNSNSRGIYVRPNRNKLTMNGGSINLSGGGSLYGIDTEYGYPYVPRYVNLNNTSINITGSSNSKNLYGVRLTEAMYLNVNSSSIIANGTTNVYGIITYENSDSTITLSNNDDDVSQTTPVVSGTTYGIYHKAGTFNFYDGIIKGETQIYGGVSDRPEDYDLVYGTDGNLNTVVLQKLDLVENIDTGVKYSKIQKAVDDCPKDTLCNLKLLYQTSLGYQLEIKNTKNISFDLNNLKITTSDSYNILNNGIITFKNGLLDSESASDFATIIENNGVLTIDGATLNFYEVIKSTLITNNQTGKLYLINNATLINNGGKSNINKVRNDGTLIKNIGGYVEIDGAIMKSKTISGATSGIYTMAKPVEMDNFVYNSGDITYKNGVINLDYWGSSGCLPLDLTDYNGEVKLNFSNISLGGYKIKAWITKTSTAPTSADTPFVNDNDSNKSYSVQSYSTTIQGGEKYYLHFGSTYGSDHHIININIEYNGEIIDLINHGNVVVKNVDYKDAGDGEILFSENSIIDYQGGIITNSTNSTGGTGIREGYSAVVNMTGGKILNKNTSVLVESYAVFNGFGGEIYNNKGNYYPNGIEAANGIVNTDGFNISIVNGEGLFDRINGIYLHDRAVANINNTNITLSTSHWDSYNRGVFIDDNSKAVISNSTINVTGPNERAYGIYVDNEHEQKIINTSVISNVYGIYVSDDVNANITITNDDTDEDGHVSTTSPLIFGQVETLRGMNTRFDFYDGILKGKKIYDYGLNNIPNGYILNKGSEESYITWTLTKGNNVLNVDDNIEFNKLQDAINSCPDNQVCNLKILNDFSLYESVTINNNKNIILDLNSKTISSKDDKYITNKGILDINNGSMNVTLGLNSNPILSNENTMTLGNNLSLSTNGYDKSRLITNKRDAKLYLNGVELSVNDRADKYDDAFGKAVYNVGGYVEFNNPVFKGGTATPMVYSIADPDIPTKTNGYDISITNGVIDSYSRTSYYIPIDLRDYSNTLEIKVLFNSLAKTTYKFYITDSVEPPTTLATPVYTTDVIDRYGEFTTSLTGGSQYYLHVVCNGSAYLNDVQIIDGNNKKSLLHRGSIVINDMDVTHTGSDSFIYTLNSEVLVKNGEIKQTGSPVGRGITVSQSSDLNIENITYTNKNVGIRAEGYSNVYIKHMNYTTTTTNGGVALDLYNSKTVVDDINIDLTCTYGSVSGINTSDYAQLLVKKANINGDLNTYAALIEVSGNSNVTLLNDVVVNANSSVSDANNIYAIKQSASSTLTIGVNDGVVSTTKPYFYGKNVGLYKGDGTFNFYDGVFESPNTPISGLANNVPEHYHVIIAGNKSYLAVESHLDNSFEYNNQYFASLNDVIDVISEQTNKTGTIKVGNDVLVESTVTIPSSVNITLALEGHTLNFDGLEKGIINQGTLTIIDDPNGEIEPNDTSSMENANGIVIDNQGVLIIGEIGKCNNNSPIIRGAAAITGNSYTKVTGQVISTDNSLSNIIANAGKAIVRFFKSLIQPTFAYKTNEYQVNNLDNKVALTDNPKIKTKEDLSVWTNQDINIGMTAHNYGVLNIASSIDDNQVKTIKYTVELYKNTAKVDSFEKTKEVQILSNEKIEVDVQYFENAHTLYDGFSLKRVFMNDNQLPSHGGVVEIDPEVEDGTVFKLYFDEIPTTTTSSSTSNETGTRPPRKTSTPTDTTKPTEETTEETTTEETTETTRRRTTTEEVKGDDIEIHVKKPFPWWIVLAVIGGLGIIGLLIWLLPILLRKKVLIGISGSVGSAVAAKLLQEKNYKVSALFINNGKNLDQLTYARQVCDKLGIDLYEQDITQVSKDNINKTITSYPTIDLNKVYNKYVLIDTLKMVSKDLHIGHISCGVYARKEGNKIIPGVNQVFDESEKMSLLSEEDIKKLVLPLGEIEYQDINKIAEANNVNFRSEKVDAKDKIGINNIPNE